MRALKKSALCRLSYQLFAPKRLFSTAYQLVSMYLNAKVAAQRHAYSVGVLSVQLSTVR